MFHISIFARLEFIFVGLEIIHTLLRLGSLRVADYAEILLAEPFILVEILLLALMYDYDCENDWDYDHIIIIRAGVGVLSYSNWLIIFLPTNEKPSSFSLSTNDKPPYIQ